MAGRCRVRSWQGVGGLRREGEGRWLAAHQLAEEVEGRAALPPAAPPHRHQHRLRPGMPPQTLRKITPKRIASSARQLVASRPGSLAGETGCRRTARVSDGDYIPVIPPAA